MGRMTIRITDSTHERLKRLAKARIVSVNKLFEEFSTAALAEFDAETPFLARAARGSARRGMALLVSSWALSTWAAPQIHRGDPARVAVGEDVDDSANRQMDGSQIGNWTAAK